MLRGQASECAAVKNPLEGMSAGTALMGYNVVFMASMSSTHKQLTQAEHRPAEKQHTHVTNEGTLAISILA